MDLNDLFKKYLNETMTQDELRQWREAVADERMKIDVLGTRFNVNAYMDEPAIDEVVFFASSPGGLSLVSDADFYSGSVAAGIIAAGGVADISPQELRSLLNGKNVNVTPYMNDLTEGFAGGASSENLEMALQLIYLYSTAPRKDPVVFNNFIEKLRVSFANAGNNPGQVFGDTLAEVLGNYHFRKMPLPQNKLDQLNLDKAMEVYRDRFADASDFTFTFVGSFKVDELKPLLARYLGSLPALNRKEVPKDLLLNLPEGRISKKVIKGKEPRAVVTLVFGGSCQYSDEASTQLQALAGTLRIALINRLREEQAGVYGVDVRSDLRKLPTGQYVFRINFICDPQNVEPLILRTNSEIMKIKMEGVSEDDITKYREGEKGGIDAALKQNVVWMNYIAGRVLKDEPLEKIDIREKLKGITSQSLQKAAVQYFNNANYIRVVLLPEPK